MHYILTKEDIYTGNLVLINQKNHLQNKIDSKELVSYNSKYPDVLLQKVAHQKIQEIFKELQIQDEFVPVSGYRTYQNQLDIFNTSIKDNGLDFTLKYVAYPDASEHQTGLAIDLGLNVENVDFICPAFPHDHELCNKFRVTSLKYGFIERYQKDKEKITHISSEEWHFRYIGYPHSTIMAEKKMCLEEYITYLKKYEYPVNPLRYQNYQIAYLAYEANTLEIDSDNILEISGNNIDGFIITWESGE